MWDVAKPTDKKFKIMISGPPGSYKSRLALRLANNGDFKNPTHAVLDTEYGTDHYSDQFAFRRKRAYDPDLIKQEIEKLLKDPGDIKTFTFDTFSVYYRVLMEKWVEIFRLREKRSAGNKGDYYTMQPRDYVHPNREASNLLLSLLESDLNIICICHNKDLWEGLKIIGSIFDGWKSLPHYFDTVIMTDYNKNKDGFEAKIIGKDRSGTFKNNETIPWESDQDIYKYMTEKMGCNLSDGGKALSYDGDADKSSGVAKENVKSEKEKDPVETKEKTSSDSSTSANPPKIVDKIKIKEIAQAKKDAKINTPDVWKEMVGKYKDANDNSIETAKDMTFEQADELIKDIIRYESESKE